MKMKLVQVGDQWQPENENDLPTFKHICNGMISVTEEHLLHELIPVFKRHGIELVLLKN